MEGARLVSLLQEVHIHIVGEAIGGPWKRVEMMMRVAMETMMIMMTMMIVIMMRVV